MKQYKNILVAIDGSCKSELAFHKSLEIAQKNNSNLYLVHIIDTSSLQNISDFDSKLITKISQSSEKLLEKYSEEAQKLNINVEFIIKCGSPKNAIANDIPKSKKIDLIVIGATGLNNIERLLIGSVTEYVVHYSKCDVLVVKPD